MRIPPAAQTSSLSGEAYDRLESLIVSTGLPPGKRFTLQDLQDISGFGRTPVHDAVKRLAMNRLIQISPRSGLLIAPINLQQEATLLTLRSEMEVFACGLASERCGPKDQVVFRRFIRDLKEVEHDLGLDRFNVTDRLLNQAVVAATGEPILENTLAPLQTLYRRTGWVYHTHVAGPSSIKEMVRDHIALLEAILDGNRQGAEQRVRTMMDGVSSMLTAVRRRVDPAILDIRLVGMKVATGV